MVKKQKDKQYNSAREQRDYSQLRNNTAIPTNNGSSSTINKSIPFHLCCLTLLPYTTPVCTRDGIIYENTEIIEYLLNNNNTDPMTGKPMTSRDLIILHMDHHHHGGGEGAVDEETQSNNHAHNNNNNTIEWQCPVLQKRFTDHMKIVAILVPSSTTSTNTATTSTSIVQKEAYVYSYEAYYELNVKAKSYYDLTTGEVFDKNKDVLVLNDPDNIELNTKRRAVSSSFHHHRTVQKQKQQQKLNTTMDNNNVSSEIVTSNNNDDIKFSLTASRIMDKIHQKQKKEQQKAQERNLLMNKTLSNDDNNNDNNIDSGDDDPYMDMSIPLSKRFTKQKILVSDVGVGNVKLTTGIGTASFTSTAVYNGGGHSGGGTSNMIDANPERYATNEEILHSQFRYMRIMKKDSSSSRKGLVRLCTSLGTITIELHCDIVPRTCMNFLGLCRKKRYDNTIFHRLIPNFMIQGGSRSSSSSHKLRHHRDNTKRQKLHHGSSIESNIDNNDNDNDIDRCLWGTEPFVDEFDDRLKHNERGIVAMANSGPNTNLCQFYITFGPCHHLDRKHTIFGRIVDTTMTTGSSNRNSNRMVDHPDPDNNRNNNIESSYDVLMKMEKVPMNPETKVPLQEIKIVSTEVLQNPAQDAYEYEYKRIQEIIRKRSGEGKSGGDGGGATNNPETNLLLIQNNTKNVIKNPSVGVYRPSSSTTDQQKQEQQKQLSSSSSLSSSSLLLSLKKKSPMVTNKTNAANETEAASKGKSAFGDFSSW